MVPLLGDVYCSNIPRHQVHPSNACSDSYFDSCFDIYSCCPPCHETPCLSFKHVPLALKRKFQRPLACSHVHGVLWPPHSQGVNPGRTKTQRPPFPPPCIAPLHWRGPMGKIHSPENVFRRGPKPAAGRTIVPGNFQRRSKTG